MSCHTAETFAHIAEQVPLAGPTAAGLDLAGGRGDASLAVTQGENAGWTHLAGRVTQVSDFRITLVDGVGRRRTRSTAGRAWRCEINDPLAAHEQM